MKQLKGTLFCLGAALFWGIAFVAQDVSAEIVEPFTFSAVRMALGCVTLALIVFIKKLATKRTPKETKTLEEKKKYRLQLIIGGIVCGVCLTLATNLQQYGLQYTTAGKSGFITACYIVLVPVIGLFFRRKCPVFVWIAIVLAAVGLYFLCIKGSITDFGKGDLITLACSVAFAMHILVVDKFAKDVDGIEITCIQALVCCLVSTALMLIFEHPNWENIVKAYVPILYTGIFSAGLAYCFQTLGQKNLNPTVASIVMSVESVVSVLAAWIILHQTLTGREIIGCVIIFAAIILAQIPKRKREIKVLY